MDEAISDFTAITGATTQVARHFLTMTDGDPQQAIQLFFDSPELGSTMPHDANPPVPPSSTRPPLTTTTASRTDSAGVVHIESDEDDIPMDDEDDSAFLGTANHPTETSTAANATAFEDDEAIARRMQEELYAGGDAASDYDTGGIRAPLARTTETLVGPGADWQAESMQDAVLQQMRARQQPRLRQGPPGVFNQQAIPSSIWDESNPDARREGLAQATGGASEASAKAAKLAELFRPPFELMSRLPWDDARQQGKDEEKWILVNVQDPSIFDCQSLNRDIWKDDGIKETVKENFIFMQYLKDDPRGSQYIQYYFPSRDSEAAYPHIAIVDPRTGEQVKVWSGPPAPKAMDFLMQLHEFLDRYSLNVSVRNPVAKRKPEKAAALEVDKLTEEQMLDLALQNSLANSTATGPREYDPDDLTKSIGDLHKHKGKEVEHAQTEVDTNGHSLLSTSSPFASISSKHPHVEPVNNPANTTRIQFRHSGGRIIRRFGVDDSVRRLYEWLKSEPINGKEGMDFELKSMGKDLIESLESSVGDAGLKNGTVMVEYLED